MQRAQIQKIFEKLQNEAPHPVTELTYLNTYTLLVAVILSAQATDKSVNKATRSLFQKVQTPEAMVLFGEAKLRHSIQSIGLYKTKAKNIIAMSKKLISQFNSEVPPTEEDLLTLNGVGLKTARVVLNVAFGKATVAVDTHVYRVAHRLGLADAQSAEETSTQLQKRIPLPWRQHAHHWLILHGRYTCTARKPRCEDCVLSKLCPYPNKTE